MALNPVFDFDKPLLARSIRACKPVDSSLVDSAESGALQKGEWVLIEGDEVSRIEAGDLLEDASRFAPVLTGVGRTDVQSSLRVTHGRNLGAIVRTTQFQNSGYVTVSTGADGTVAEDLVTVASAGVDGSIAGSTITLTGNVLADLVDGASYSIEVTTAGPETETFYFDYADVTYDSEDDETTIAATADGGGGTPAGAFTAPTDILYTADSVALVGAFADAQYGDVIRFTAGDNAGTEATIIVVVDDDTVLTFPNGTLTPEAAAADFVVYRETSVPYANGSALAVGLVQDSNDPSVLRAILTLATGLTTTTADGTTPGLLTGVGPTVAKVLRTPYRLTGVGSDGEQQAIDVLL